MPKPDFHRTGSGILPSVTEAPNHQAVHAGGERVVRRSRLKLARPAARLRGSGQGTRL